MNGGPALWRLVRELVFGKQLTEESGQITITPLRDRPYNLRGELMISAVLP
jgi:hypothetical protein